jgi:hypothetical protein
MTGENFSFSLVILSFAVITLAGLPAIPLLPPTVFGAALLVRLSESSV